MLVWGQGQIHISTSDVYVSLFFPLPYIKVDKITWTSVTQLQPRTTLYGVVGSTELEACNTKPAQHCLVLLGLPGFTEPNIGCPWKCVSHKAGNQLALLKSGFTDPAIAKVWKMWKRQSCLSRSTSWQPWIENFRWYKIKHLWTILVIGTARRDIQWAEMWREKRETLEIISKY